MKMILIVLGLTCALDAANPQFSAEYFQPSKTLQSLTDIPVTTQSEIDLQESKADFMRRNGANALWLSDAGEAEKAKALLAKNPTDADLNYIYGAYLMRQGRKVDALMYLIGAAEADPEMVLYQIEAGRALTKMGNHAGAVRYFERAKNLSFEDIHRLNELGDALVKAGKIALGRQAYEQSLRLHAQQPEITHKLETLPRT